MSLRMPVGESERHLVHAGENERTIGFELIVGNSDGLQKTFDQIEKVANTDVPVLLLGETGTGKELLARAIHEHSSRRHLVKVDCGSLASSLIESEFFGHAKGAFTSAHSNRTGRFQLADGGTLFLDEIGELGLDVQAKLLRVLEEGAFEPVGKTTTVQVDVRIIAATNRDLRQEMQNGRFRPDLFDRLSVFPIRVEPLRERREDIPMLAWHFIHKHRDKFGKTFDTISEKGMNALMDHDWPGNVRELENVIERAMILSPGPSLRLEGQFDLLAEPDNCNSMTRLDRSDIVDVLERCHWKVKGHGNAAEQLGQKPSTLRYHMKKLGIIRPDCF